MRSLEFFASPLRFSHYTPAALHLHQEAMRQSLRQRHRSKLPGPPASLDSRGRDELSRVFFRFFAILPIASDVMLGVSAENESLTHSTGSPSPFESFGRLSIPGYDQGAHVMSHLFIITSESLLSHPLSFRFPCSTFSILACAYPCSTFSMLACAYPHASSSSTGGRRRA